MGCKDHFTHKFSSIICSQFHSFSRLERHTLNILNTWQTTQPKLSALNAFIVCGVLYVVNYETLIIDYKFNTTSNTEEKVREH